MMGLRLSEGLDIDRTRRIGGAWSDAMPLSDFEDLGLIWRTEDRFGATLRGRLVLNALVTELLAD